MSYRPFSPAKRGASGFTLIELLVGLTLSVLIGLCLARVFHSARLTWRSVEKRMALHQEARGILEQMARELRNSIEVPGVQWNGERNGITFATVQGTKIMKVVYRQASPRVLENLRQELSPESLREAIASRLTPRPATLEWEYAYQGSNDPVEWRKEWKPLTDDALPPGLRVRLTLYDDEGDSDVYIKTIFTPAGGPLPWHS